MGITIHSSFLPHVDAEASLTFYRDVLGFEVRLDVGAGRMRWITVGPEGQPDTAIVLHPATVARELTDDERVLIDELVAKGSYFGVNLATDDLDATFAALEAAGADVVQEPIEQDYGLRDAAVRDPAGNLIRIQQTRSTP
ncbi:VOC family protein [Agrococcus versicolor]|uniref:VOC family protein n=1 Tax=Agrococcus versicolor TaxID=501482 RepID=A0ABP5MR60_9MICO